jgi:hypothetical protein
VVAKGTHVCFSLPGEFNTVWVVNSRCLHFQCLLKLFGNELHY